MLSLLKPLYYFGAMALISNQSRCFDQLSMTRKMEP